MVKKNFPKICSLDRDKNYGNGAAKAGVIRQ